MLYYILGGIAAVLILAAVLSVLLKKRKIKKLGIDGEKKVARVLKKYAGIRSYKVINDLYLPLYDKTTQIDHVLVGFFGILVVETKNLAGEVYGDPKKKEWLHVVGTKKHQLYNPLMQNQAHIDCIRHILGKENMYSVNIESLVVFSNKKVQLYVPNKLPIINIKKLKKYLHKDRFEKDNNFDVEQITNILMNYQVTDKKLIANHNKNVKIMAKNNK
ncbi:MAG: nuclease-related domain-containing protein [Oscillospiraceae bacterium]